MTHDAPTTMPAAHEPMDPELAAAIEEEARNVEAALRRRIDAERGELDRLGRENAMLDHAAELVRKVFEAAIVAAPGLIEGLVANDRSSAENGATLAEVFYRHVGRSRRGR